MSCQPCEKSYKCDKEVCPALGYQEVIVGVPVEIKPFAKVGKVKTECVGKPIIKRGSVACEGRPRTTCKFTVSQKISVAVPILFGAKTDVGEANIDCKHCPFKYETEPEKEIKFSKESSEEEYYTGMIG